MINLRCIAIQFLSRPFKQPDTSIGWTRKTAQGREIIVSGKYFIGEQLLYGAGKAFGVRPFFAQPWPESPSIGAVQYVDPYAKLRWPAYILLEVNISLPNENYSREVLEDTLQYMRGITCWGLFNDPSLITLKDQQCVRETGYRWGYFTSGHDFIGNPRPNPNGRYVYSDPEEAKGPGFVTIRNFDALSNIQIGKDELSDIANFLEEYQMALVWSQAFSMPNRTTIELDKTRIEELVEKLKNHWLPKRNTETKLHWNSYDELVAAEELLALPKNYAVKATIRFMAPAVEAGLKFYKEMWTVSFTRSEEKQYRKSSFDEKIEMILKKANRPSYKAINPVGSATLLHLYDARSAMHEGDIYFEDDSGHKVHVTTSIASKMLEEATKFLLWLDSQV